jgi:dipeptidyl aminopeptidase/acylaminoacyl peptidase
MLHDLHCIVALTILQAASVKALAAQGMSVNDGTGDQGRTRAVTMADVVGLTTLGDPEYAAGGTAKDRVAQFSPDGKRFVVVLRKGNLQDNTNEFSILLWNTANVFRSPRPDTLLVMASSSNRPAIDHITWLADNETLVFLGERPGELTQLYRFNVRTRALERLTHHPTNLIAYSVTRTAAKIVYTAEAPSNGFFHDEKARRNGVVVATQFLGDLLTDHSARDSVQLYLKERGKPSWELKPTGQLSPWYSLPFLAPDGNSVVVATAAAAAPPAWREYSAAAIRLRLERRHGSGPLFVYRLIDTRAGQSGTLLDAPLDYYSNAAWSPDSRSVVLSGVFLPLDGTNAEERKARRGRSFTIEVGVASGGLVKVSEDNLRVLSWDTRTNEAAFQVGEPASYRYDAKILMRRAGAGWERVERTAPGGRAVLDVSIEEDFDLPPTIFVIDSGSRQKNLLLDPNPQLRELQLGRVEETTWRAKDGRGLKGGLFYPIHYVPGKRYPLVIQTHAWWGHRRFHLDGPWSDNYAAQPLAGKDIMVLQMDEEEDKANPLDAVADVWNTKQEAPRALGAYEAAIDYLDVKGLIDRARVGLVGFSRTCWYVKYALTHSRYHFAAASVMDGIDAGYLQYIMIANDSQYVIPTENQNGGMPFGSGLSSWVEHSPVFGIDKVKAPIFIVAPRRESSLGEWEWFAALSRLRKPVELVLLDDGPHELEKPWHRMVAGQGTADWFVFWLKGEEDPDPAKAEQYARWRELRKLQQQSTDSGQTRSEAPTK